MIGRLILVMMVLSPLPLPVAPVPVRFVEGAEHGFLILRTVDGAYIASGDLLQVVRGGGVESRMVFRFQGWVVIRRDGGIHPATGLVPH